MRNLVYLPLVLAFLLSGCKVSSFTRQRYTKFANAVHKLHVENRIAARGKIPLPLTDKKINMVIPPATAGSGINKERAATVGDLTFYQSDKMRFPAGGEVTTINDGQNRSVFSKRQVPKGVEKNRELAGKPAKSFAERVKASMGVIGLALKIVLFILAIALIVGIIILVILI